MNKQVIQDWTSSEVLLNHGARRDVKYAVFKQGEKIFQEIAAVMKDCLERAVEKGELKTSKDITGLATYLATEFRASLMLAASGVSRVEIERHFDVALQVLD